MGTKSFFDLVNEFQTFNFAGSFDWGSFHGGWVRAGVAMAALKTSCKDGFLKLLLERCRSGELVDVRILRDKERKAKTIKQTATYSKQRATRRTKRELAKWSQKAVTNWVTQESCNHSSCPIREGSSANALAFPANCRVESSPLKLFFEFHMNVLCAVCLATSS
jgi:hypothetical protein